MKAPHWTDQYVRVSAYLTDESFGYDHWRAAQFAAPSTRTRPALLVLCESDEEVQCLLTALHPVVERA